MRERPHTTRIPSEDPLFDPAEAPQISTPVIDIQDVEYQPTHATRVPNKGVKIPPRLDDEDLRDFAKEDEDALLALEQIEKAIRGQLPG